MINQSKSAFHRLSFAPFALLVAALTLAACESVDIEAAVQRSTPIDSEALPADVRLAAAAVAMAMKGYGPGEVQGVAFADGAATGVREAELNYDGFAVQALDVVSYQVTTGPVAGAELGGLMLLSDPMGRRAAVRFLATYEFSGPGITITHASVTPLFARRPVTQAFIVPY
ncbi:MAG: hypothetical protein HOB82_05015, partial [Alphaproteobacteria bacterium]|nr:hypothetical protein [Alphaproteobacteria bacterium]